MKIVEEPRAAAPRRTFRQNLKHWVGLDRAIAFTVLARFWSAAAGVVTIILIARFLTPKEQGYYFTFSSLVALQIVFELGFSFVILQLAAHERAQLSFLPKGGIEGSPTAYSRLASVLQKSVRWYLVAGLLMTAALLPAGLYFFSTHQPPSSEVHWKLPWVLIVVAAFLTFQLDPVFSFLEGCGSVLQVAKMRLSQALLGSLLAWTAMALHHGLFSPALMILGQASVGAAFLLAKRQRTLVEALLSHPVGKHNIDWRREIWPFQWRIAISWLCGYFIFQLFNPVLFAYQGPVVAGRMGMSLSISSSIGAVAIAWINTKASPFGNLIARGEINLLDSLFFRTLWQSTILLGTAAFGFFTALLLAGRYLPRYAARVLPPWVFCLLLLTTIMNHIVFCLALYLRAHKREPFLGVTVIGAALLALSTLSLGRFYGANAVTIGYFSITAVFGLPSAYYIFTTKRRQWHVSQ